MNERIARRVDVLRAKWKVRHIERPEGRSVLQAQYVDLLRTRRRIKGLPPEEQERERALFEARGEDAYRTEFDRTIETSYESRKEAARKFAEASDMLQERFRRTGNLEDRENATIAARMSLELKEKHQREKT